MPYTVKPVLQAHTFKFTSTLTQTSFLEYNSLWSTTPQSAIQLPHCRYTVILLGTLPTAAYIVPLNFSTLSYDQQSGSGITNSLLVGSPTFCLAGSPTFCLVGSPTVCLAGSPPVCQWDPSCSSLVFMNTTVLDLLYFLFVLRLFFSHTVVYNSSCQEVKVRVFYVILKQIVLFCIHPYTLYAF